MGCLKSILLFVLGCIVILIGVGYLSHKLGEAESERLANMTPEERLEEEEANKRRDCQFDKLFIIKQSIKSNLKDPDSFKELNTKFYSNAIEITYSATNSFGGRVSSSYRYMFEPDICGTNTKVEEIK